MELQQRKRPKPKPHTGFATGKHSVLGSNRLLKQVTIPAEKLEEFKQVYKALHKKWAAEFKAAKRKQTQLF